MKIYYKLKSFLPGPWALNTAICVLFMAINMTLIVRTEFTFLLYYDIVRLFPQNSQKIHIFSPSFA